MRLLFLLLILISKLSLSQEVNGVIIYSQQPIPFANIHVASTSNGTFANSKGAFNLIVNNLSDTLVISATGYKTKRIIADSVLLNPIIKLDKSNQKLDIVTVNVKDNYAETIIQKVVKNRKRNDYQQNNFISNLYTKSILSQDGASKTLKDTLRLSFAEKFSLIEYSSDHWKETKLGVKDISIKEKSKGIYNQTWGSSMRRKLMDSQTKSNLFYANISDGNFNFYKATILIPKLAQNPFISPLGILGKASYNYRYEGAFFEKDQLIHKISIAPKRQEESVFKGTVHISDSTWAIVSVELDMNGKSLRRYQSFKIYQRYSKLNDLRVLDRQEFFFYYTSNTSSKKYHGAVYSKFSNYNFHVENLKVRNLARITTDSAYSRDSNYWENKRSIKLTGKESEFLSMSDSLEKIKKSAKYIRIQDSLKNQTTIWEVLLNGYDHYNTSKGLKWKIDPIIKQTRIFGIGGYRHALGGQLVKEFDNKNELFLSGTANYGFKNQDLLADGDLKYTYAPKHFAQLRIAGGNKYQMLTYMQNISNLFSRGNFVKNDFISAGHFLELINGVFFDINIKYMQRSSLSNLNLSNWSNDLFGEDNKPNDFNNYNELNFKTILSFTPFQKYALEGRKKVVLGSKWPTIHVGWEQGVPDVLNSKIDYQKIKTGLDYSFKFGLLGTTKMETWYGHYLNTNTIEYPNYTFFRGTDNYFFSHPIYSFQLLGNTHKSVNNYATLNYIHHFHGAIIKKIPYLKKTKLETVTGGGLLYINDNNFKHSEIYNGLEIPFRIGETQMKFGGYYAIAYSNYSNISNMLKFGLNVFNPFTNKWAF